VTRCIVGYRGIWGALMSDQLSAEDRGDISVGGEERRTGERYRSVWRIAKITRADDIGLWRVRNISSRGMMLATDVSVAVGEALTIELSETVLMEGQIVWAKEGRCGVSFAEPVDVSSILKTLADEQKEQGYRQLRLPYQHEAEIYVDGQTYQIQLTNLSQSGVGFIFDGSLEIGKPLGLKMPDQVRRTAVVRWIRGDQGGLWLTEPLGRADLESIKMFEGAPARRGMNEKGPEKSSQALCS
jgi:hypothetical protein